MYFFFEEKKECFGIFLLVRFLCFYKWIRFVISVFACFLFEGLEGRKVGIKRSEKFLYFCEFAFFGDRTGRCI